MRASLLDHVDNLSAVDLSTLDQTRDGLLVVELCNRYDEHAKSYYVRNGQTTSEIAIIKAAIRALLALYGSKRAEDFTVREFKDVRAALLVPFPP